MMPHLRDELPSRPSLQNFWAGLKFVEPKTSSLPKASQWYQFKRAAILWVLHTSLYPNVRLSHEVTSILPELGLVISRIAKRRSSIDCPRLLYLLCLACTRRVHYFQCFPHSASVAQKTSFPAGTQHGFFKQWSFEELKYKEHRASMRGGHEEHKSSDQDIRGISGE